MLPLWCVVVDVILTRVDVMHTFSLWHGSLHMFHFQTTVLNAFLIYVSVCILHVWCHAFSFTMT